MLERTKRWTKQLKSQLATLVLVMQHSRTPWYAKAIGGLTLLYALSPIDLIPDFIPILGYLDDLLIVPIGIWLTLALIPNDVWKECELEVKRRKLKKPRKDWKGVLLVGFIWLLSAFLFYLWLSPLLPSVNT